MEFTITASVDLGIFENIDDRFESLARELQNVIEQSGDDLKGQWIQEAKIALKNPGSYVQRITDGLMYPFEGDPYHLLIVNDHPAAIALESGYAAFDMKKGLLTGKKVRTAKDGHKYVIVPFEHSEESIRKTGIDLNEVRRVSASTWKTRGQDIRPPERHQYEWGEALTDVGDVGKKRKYFTGLGSELGRSQAGKPNTLVQYKNGKPASATIDYLWKGSPFENMYRFEVGGKTHDRTTFRTMSETSDANSWIHPGIRAMNICAQAVAAVDPIFQERVSKTVARFLGTLFKQ